MNNEQKKTGVSTDNISLKTVDGNPFDERRAKEEIDNIIKKYIGESEETDRPITTRARKILSEDMPATCFVASRSDPEGMFVPAWIIEYLANQAFADRWSSEIIKNEVYADRQESVAFPSRPNGRPVEKNVHRVIATAQVKVTVRSPNGNLQTHEGFGVATYDADWGSNDVATLYRIVLKGAVTDARRTALSQFGNLLNPRSADRDLILTKMKFDQQKSQTVPPPPKVQSKQVSKKGKPIEDKDSTEIALLDEKRNLIGASDMEDALEWIQKFENQLTSLSNPQDRENFLSENTLALDAIKNQFGEKLKEQLEHLSLMIDGTILGEAGLIATPPEETKEKNFENTTKKDAIGSKKIPSSADYPLKDIEGKDLLFLPKTLDGAVEWLNKYEELMVETEGNTKILIDHNDATFNEIKNNHKNNLKERIEEISFLLEDNSHATPEMFSKKSEDTIDSYVERIETKNLPKKREELIDTIQTIIRDAPTKKAAIDAVNKILPDVKSFLRTQDVLEISKLAVSKIPV